MNSTLLIIYNSILIGQMIFCAWALLAYGRAFLAVRRLDYALTSASGLAGIVTLAVAYAFSDPHPSGIATLPLAFAPVLAIVSAFGARAFSASHSAHFFEYRAMRDIMLFRQPLPAPQREGLFVPVAPPQRPSPWAILAMTVGMIGACALLALLR